MGSTGNAPRTSPLYPRRSSKRGSGVGGGTAVNYRRQVLQGRIDLIRAELVRRGSVALSPEELVRVLMGKEERP
jgi:hypothetical protein